MWERKNRNSLSSGGVTVRRESYSDKLFGLISELIKSIWIQGKCTVIKIAFLYTRNKWLENDFCYPLAPVITEQENHIPGDKSTERCALSAQKTVNHWEHHRRLK